MSISEEQHEIPCLLDESDFQRLDEIYASIFPQRQNADGVLQTPPPILEAEELEPTLFPLQSLEMVQAPDHRPLETAQQLTAAQTAIPSDQPLVAAQTAGHPSSGVAQPSNPLMQPRPWDPPSVAPTQMPHPASICPQLHGLLQPSPQQVLLQLGPPTSATLVDTHQQSDGCSPIDESAFRAEWFTPIGGANQPTVDALQPTTPDNSWGAPNSAQFYTSEAEGGGEQVVNVGGLHLNQPFYIAGEECAAGDVDGAPSPLVHYGEQQNNQCEPIPIPPREDQLMQRPYIPGCGGKIRVKKFDRDRATRSLVRGRWYVD